MLGYGQQAQYGQQYVLGVWLSRCGSLCNRPFTIHPKIVGRGGGGGGGGEERVWNGIMVSEFLVPNGTHYVMNVAWCGCTIFDQTVPEGIHFMGVASFSPHQIDYIRWCIHCVMGVASNKMYQISWHEFGVCVGVAYFFAQMTVPDGVQVVV